MSPIEYINELTPRQKQALIYTAKGLRGTDIAKLWGCTRHNVNQLMNQVYVKLEVSNACEASVVAAKANIV